MKIYLASINLGDKPKPRTPPHRLFSYYELRNNVFGIIGIMDVFGALLLINDQIKRVNSNENILSNMVSRKRAGQGTD